MHEEKEVFFTFLKGLFDGWLIVWLRLANPGEIFLIYDVNRNHVFDLYVIVNNSMSVLKSELYN